MRRTTHINIATLINSKVRLTDKDLERISVYADNHKRDVLPKHNDLKLNRHHDIEVNRIRIKKLISSAKDSYQEFHLRSAAIFDYFNALHFLCDSAVPSLDEADKEDQMYVEDLFEKVEIDPDWNDALEEELCESDVENIIDNFLDEMPVSSDEREDVDSAMKKTYQTALQLARYVAYVDKEIREKYINKTGVEFKTGSGGRIFPV